MATEVIRYVDPNAEAGGDGTTNALTGANCAFTSLNAWEAARQRDLVTADEIERVICSSDDAGETHAEDTTDCTIDGWTTGSTRYIQIEAASNHNGKWNDNIYRKTQYNQITNQLTVSEANVVISGIQLSMTYTSAAAAGPKGITVRGVTENGTTKLRRLIVRGITSSGYSNGGGIETRTTPAGLTLVVENCLVYGFVSNSGGVQAGLSVAGTVIVRNCTVRSCGYGYRRTSGTMSAINCGASASITAAFDGTITQTTCSSVTPTFVDVANYDFHLAPSDTTWKNAGTDLSTHFTDDIDGETRPTGAGTWDIGADEYVSPPNVTVTNLPAGSSVTVSDGVDTASADTVDGTCTVDVSSLTEPFVSITVYDSGDNIIGIITDDDYPDMQGGDTFNYTPGVIISANANFASPTVTVETAVLASEMTAQAQSSDHLVLTTTSILVLSLPFVASSEIGTVTASGSTTVESGNMFASAEMPAGDVTGEIGHIPYTVIAEPFTAYADVENVVIQGALFIICSPFVAAVEFAVPNIQYAKVVYSESFIASASSVAVDLIWTSLVVSPTMDATAQIGSAVAVIVETTVVEPFSISAAFASPLVVIPQLVTIPTFTAEAEAVAPALYASVVVVATSAAASADVVEPIALCYAVVSSVPFIATAEIPVPEISSEVIVQASALIANVLLEVPKVQVVETTEAEPFEVSSSFAWPTVLTTRSALIVIEPMTADGTALAAKPTTSEVIASPSMVASITTIAPVVILNSIVSAPAFLVGAEIAYPSIHITSSVTTQSEPFTAFAIVDTPRVSVLNIEGDFEPFFADAAMVIPVIVTSSIVTSEAMAASVTIGQSYIILIAINYAPSMSAMALTEWANVSGTALAMAVPMLSECTLIAPNTSGSVILLIDVVSEVNASMHVGLWGLDIRTYAPALEANAFIITPRPRTTGTVSIAALVKQVRKTRRY